MLEAGRVDRPNQLKVVILQDNDYRRAFVGTPGTPTFSLCVSGSVADKALLAFLPGLGFSGGEKIWCECSSCANSALGASLTQILDRSTLCVSLPQVLAPNHPPHPG